MKLSRKQVIFTKRNFITDVRLSSEYASASILNFFHNKITKNKENN